MQVVNKEWLVREMQRKNFSLERMARYAGCSKGMVSHLTSGRRKTCSPILALNIAEALDLDVELLFVPQVSTQQGRNANRMRTKEAA
jgi:transcriptional regulator with XRE-family HTH domain